IAGVRLRWLGCTGTFAERPTGTSSRSRGHCSSYRVGYSGGFRASDRMASINSDGRCLRPYKDPPWDLCVRFLPVSIYECHRFLLRHPCLP
ncbi:hypothetical protein PIB30_112382, partial [Stylosanthes scabra]|nr:hypothetical protein [Stylosanthes scabra]